MEIAVIATIRANQFSIATCPYATIKLHIFVHISILSRRGSTGRVRVRVRVRSMQ